MHWCSQLVCISRSISSCSRIEGRRLEALSGFCPVEPHLFFSLVSEWEPLAERWSGLHHLKPPQDVCQRLWTVSFLRRKIIVLETDTQSDTILALPWHQTHRYVIERCLRVHFSLKNNDELPAGLWQKVPNPELML